MRVLAAAAAVALACTAQAGAAVKPPHLDRMVAVAEAFYPDACDPTLDWWTRPDLGRKIWAWAYMPACHVELTPNFDRGSVHQQCGVIVHEWGHLSGLEHVDEKGEIMHPTHRNPPRGCDRLARRVG